LSDTIGANFAQNATNWRERERSREKQREDGEKDKELQRLFLNKTNMTR
jgi:hypothetical protein